MMRKTPVYSFESKERVRQGGRASGKARAQSFQVIRDIYMEDPQKCGFCDQALPFEKRTKKFCSRSCSVSATNRRRGQERVCLLCQGPRKHGAGKFCSRECHREYEFQSRIQRWQKGEISGGNQFDLVLPWVRRYLIETRGERCEICLWDRRHPITNKVPLNVHHLDDCSDHSEQNLQLLCPCCHSLTESFGSLNKGHGRKKRPGIQDMVSSPAPTR